MTKKKSGKERMEGDAEHALTTAPKKEIVVPEAPVYNDPLPGRVIKDFGLYRVVVAKSTVEEMKGRIVYAVINNDTGVIEEECSVLPQALLHAGQFAKEMRNDGWERRLNPTPMMVPTGPAVIEGPKGRGH